MNTRWGFAPALAACALLIAGCAGNTGPGSGEVDPPSSEASPASAAWLDEGRLFAVVTWGSSSCVPVVETAVAEGQHVTVTFVKEDATRVCTMDYAPRASLVGLPAGVDPTRDLQVTIIDPMAPDALLHTQLAGQASLSGRGGEPTDYAPSAGWFSEGVVLLTWGSSSCPPVIENLVESNGGAAVTIKTEDGVCTADMAPRLTMLGLASAPSAGAVLTLDGGDFDGVRVPIIGR